MEPSLDHLGPMGARTEDVARLLSVIAGPDSSDFREQSKARAQAYLNALNRDTKSLRIGVLKQGFQRPESSSGTDQVVLQALTELERAGATIEDVSIPWHRDASDISVALTWEGAASFIFDGDAIGHGFEIPRDEALTSFWAANWRKRVNDLSEISKLALLLNYHARRSYRGRHYVKAQSLRTHLRAAYDAVLKDFDVLAMPTIPFPAPPLPSPSATISQRITAAIDMEGNTAPFNLSGHPAISVPCGHYDGMPIGLMFAGKPYDEEATISAAASLERLNLFTPLNRQNER